jgi:hypothetical protein
VDFNGFDREPIVFVHGWKGGFNPFCFNHDIQFFQDMDSYFASVDNDLEKAGYYIKRASLMTWTCWTASLDDNAVWVKDAIDRAKAATGRDTVILIGHSMGGLVSRAYIESELFKQEWNRDVSKLFTFGSPHLGTAVDYYSSMLGVIGEMGLGAYCDSYGPAICEMTVEGMFSFNRNHPQPNGVDYYLVSGAANPWDLNAPGLMAYSALGGWNGIANDAAVLQESGLGLNGFHHRLYTSEAHRVSVGTPNYFSKWEGASSQSYQKCLEPVLLDDDSSTTCGSQSTLSATSHVQDATMAAHTPLQYGVLLPGQTMMHDLILGSGSTMVATQWLSGTVTVTLVDPHGAVIDPTYAADHPDQVMYETDEGIAIYTLTDTEAGVWQVQMHADNDIPAEGTSYSLVAFFDSERIFSAESDRMWYAPGETATLSVQFDPAPATTVVSATVLLADGEAEVVELVAEGGGQHQGTYTVPNVPGYAEVRFITSGDTAEGEAFERGQSIVFQISPTTVALSGVYADTPQPRFPGSDTYRTLDVSIGIDVSAATTITLSADLVDAGGSTVAHAITTATVDLSDETLTLRFSGDDIYSARTNGPYTLTHVLLTDQSGVTLALAEADDVYATTAYDYHRFAAGVVYLPRLMK